MSQSSLFKGIEWLSSQLQSKKSGVTPDTALGPDEATEIGRLKLIDDNMTICIKTGRLLFAVPYTYSAENKLEISTSKWYNFAYRVTVVTCTMATILKLYSILRDVQNGSFHMRNRVDPFRILHFLICAMCCVMQVNFALKADDIRETWQSMLIVANARIKKERLDRVEKICDLLMKFFYVNTGFAQVAVIIAFAMDCRFHTLATILPTCSADGRTHRHPFLMLPLYFIHFCTTTSYTPCISLTANLIIVAVQIMKKVLDDLKEAVVGDGELTKAWVTTYRAIQIIVVGYNRCFGATVIPSFILLLVLSSVFCNYIILTPGTDLVSNMYSCTVTGGLGVFTVLVMQDATYFPADSRAAILSRSRARRKRVRSYTQAILNSCPPYKIFVGKFFYLNEDLIPVLLSTIIESTIDVLLAY